MTRRRRRLQLGGGFQPTNLSNLQLWLDAADTSTISDTSGSVDQWDDKSGNGHNASGSATERPITNSVTVNGLNAIDFDGTNDFVTVSTLTLDWNNIDYTIFGVASLDSDATSQFRGIVGNRFGAGASTGWWTLGADSTPRNEVEIGPAAGVRVFGDGFDPTGQGAYVSSFEYDSGASTITMYRNGQQINTGTTAGSNTGGTTNVLRIGRWFSSNQVWDGPICEVIIYNRLVTSAELDIISTYLQAKWGI